MKVALGAILRDEFPYILEWIAHHRNMGIDHFFIANHGSTDGSTELLEALEKLGIITTFYIPGDTDAPQIPAYDRIMRENRQNYDWIGFMDLDEFWIPTADLSLKEILQNQPENSGGVVFNWAVYGSSFQKYPDDKMAPRPVTKRFFWRANIESELNLYIKSFVKTAAYSEEFQNGDAHAFPLAKSYIYTGASGKTVDISPQNPSGKSATNWELARINHYLIKSQWEYFTKKLKRGLADHPKGNYRNWNFFVGHDKNEVFELMDERLASNIDSEITNLKRRLQEVGYHYPAQTAAFENEVQYAIENIIIEDETVKFIGWSFDANGRLDLHDRDFVVKNNDHNSKIMTINGIRRMDILEKFPYADPICGFEIIFFPLPKSDTENFVICEDDIPFLEVNPIEKTCKFL